MIGSDRMSIMDNRPINRIERRKQSTRQRLLDAATTLMQQRGYAHLTIKAITDLADLGYGTFYVHFDTREAITWEVFIQWADQTQATLEQAVSVYPSPQREYQAWVGYFESIWQFREAYLGMFGPEGSPVLRARYQQYTIDAVLRNLSERRYTPQIDLPLDYVAHYLAGTQLQLADWLVTPGCPYSPKEIAGLLFRTIYHQAPPLS